jgi:hypothetical protein
MAKSAYSLSMVRPDGLFFIDVQKPSTLLPGDQAQAKARAQEFLTVADQAVG